MHDKSGVFFVVTDNNGRQFSRLRRLGGRANGAREVQPGSALNGASAVAPPLKHQSSLEF